MTHRYILTGAPGAGKTALIRHLASLGHSVVEEAATDVITHAQALGVEAPWERPGFITDIADLQASREAVPTRSPLRFSDRSLFCTIALAEWLGHPVPAMLLARAHELIAARWFESRVFFIAQLDFIENTAARRIDFTEATRFGAHHHAVYRRFGFDILEIVPATVPERAARLLASCG